MQDGSVSPIGSFFRNKWVRLILIVDILAIIGIIAIIIYNLTKNSIINFTIAPIDATITVNGNSSYHNGSYQFHPGTYEVVIYHDGLNSKTFTVELQDNSNAAITTFLSGSDNFDFYRLKDNYSSYLALERIAAASDNQTTDHDTSAEEFIADFRRNYNLYSTQLPATYSEYDDNNELVKYISVNKSDKCDVTLCIKALMNSESDRTLADSLLQGKGFNLEDFEIEYKVFY